jgi:putative transposase
MRRRPASTPLDLDEETCTPWENGVMESFNGKFRDECLSLEWFRSRAEAKVIIETWRRHYNPASQHPSVYVVEEKRFF